MVIKILVKLKQWDQWLCQIIHIHQDRHFYVWPCRLIVSRDETVLQYIDILQYLLLQYNTIWLKANIDILHIAIYYNVCCFNVLIAQSLHHKNDWTSKNLDYTLQFFMVLYGYKGCLFFTLLPKPMLPSKSIQILQYGNILQYTQTQYAIQY